MLLVSVSAYKQAGAERKNDLIAERWGGEPFVGVPERRVAVVQYTITTRVDGDVLKYFGAIV